MALIIINNKDKANNTKVKRNNKMIMNRNFKLFMVALLLVTAPAVTHAREWTLKDCIDYALAYNIALQKTRLAKASANEDYLQSKAALLPSLSASTSHNVNYTPWMASGISGDGFSRASVDKVYYNGTYSVSGNYTLWNGNKIIIKSSSTSSLQRQPNSTQPRRH